MSAIVLRAADEARMLALGAWLGQLTGGCGLIFLRGDLGAGKTTFSRGILRGLGHGGHVKSPTFTLVEPYELATGSVFHFDLYRLGDPEELEFMGIRDYLDDDRLCLIEWPERGLGLLPKPDLDITITAPDEGRQLNLLPATERGQCWAAALSDWMGQESVK